MTTPVSFFAAVTLPPVALLFMGGILGGYWITAALIYLTVFAFSVDRLAGVGTGPGTANGENRAADTLSLVLAILHFPLLALAVWMTSGASGMAGFERIIGFFAFGLFFGQVSNSNAHELIHRSRAPLYQLGKWVFVSHLFGHHASAHRLVHHRYVGTDMDPSSAPLGMGFYHYAPRAWLGSFRAGYLAENWRRAASDTNTIHPYITYSFGAILMLSIATVIAGFGGLLSYLGLATYATTQLLLSDYVQHYGLRRGLDVDGKPLAIGPEHSWNSKQRFTSLLMLNAPRHSDHHDHPARPYPALGLPERGPTLPHSLAVMGAIALLPKRWRTLMDGRVLALEKRESNW